MSEKDIAKLDPRFQTVIAEEIPESRLIYSAPHPEPVAIQEDGSNVYGAVIYTTEPDAVTSIGITVNSVLPKFVTARVTAKQLVRLVKLDAVRYIDAGRKEFIQKE